MQIILKIIHHITKKQKLQQKEYSLYMQKL